MSRMTRRAAATSAAGEVAYRGRYLTRRAIFERIQSSREWRGAVPFENETHWGLVLGSAHISILKAPPPVKITYLRRRKP